MSEVLFPARQRCRKCHKGLGSNGAHVWLGLYCSARCAGMASLPTDPNSAAVPRGCKTQRDGAWAFKKRYRSEQEIPARLREDPSTNWYWGTECCGALHIGHSRPIEAEPLRIVKTRADIGDTLVKLRGRATRTQVAAAAKVRPIRLKELEEGVPHPQGLDTLLAVLPVLQAGLGVSIGQPTNR